jgi:23S rRNA (uracil1939-C5)-methyltransferase
MKNLNIQPVEGLSNPFYYRNKTQIPFKNKNHRIVYGLYRRGTHEIVPIDYCMVENREANQVLKIVKEWAEKYHIPLYRETDQTGNLRYVVIRKGEFTGQIMVILVINKPTTHLPELQKILRARISGLTSIILNYNSTTGNTILSEKNEVIWGKPFIEETFLGVHFRIYPNTFFQISPVQAVRMTRKLQSLISLDKQQSILDLFCGIGVMGLVNAHQTKKIIGIDVNAHAISAAQENAKLNHVENAVFLVSNLQKRVSSYLPQDFNPDIVLLDPPRKGLTAPFIRSLVELKPEFVIYISCYPPSLLEDMAFFHENHYTADEIFPFDFFPQTAHVESLVILKKRK